MASPEPHHFSRAESLQQNHYDSIASRYALHYGDKWSQRYRRQFINEPLFGSLDLSGKATLDAMCGSGETTEHLIAKGALVTGLDISGDVIEQFRRSFPNCTARCGSVLSTGLESDSYDCVVVIGGLHHVQPHVHEAITEIHRLLKVGGYFCFAEPHRGSLPDIVRQVWYRHDRLFAENEAALEMAVLRHRFASHFEFVMERYAGNVAYLLVFNSLIFRMPPSLKAVYSPFLLKIESAIARMQGRRMSCFVLARWKKC